MGILFNDVLEGLKNIDDNWIVFIKDNQRDLKMSYSMIYDKSLHALSFLQSKGVKRGMEAVFQISNQEDFVVMCWACLMGGIVPVPLNVVSNYEQKMQLLRIWSILENPFILTDNKTSVNILDFLEENAEKEVCKEIQSKLVLFNNFENELYKEAVLYKPFPEDTALLLFSSGSTGEPKAVIITHENLIINTSSIKEELDINDISGCCLNWMPLTHVVGLVLMHFTSIVAKMNQVIMQPSLFVTNPVLWLKKVDEYEAVMLSMPNFGMKHVVEKVKNNLDQTIDLSKIRIIYDAGEPISINICNEFLEDLEKYNLNKNSIVPLFGMTEATIGITAAKVGESINVLYIDRRNIEIGDQIIELDSNDDNALPFVDLGKTFSCCKIRICDRKNNLFEDDTVGYIQIKGGAVTKGYYKNEEATSSSISNDGWLITGDLGFIRDGSLFVTGREKDIIFSNGQNFYPYDIERVAATAKGVNGRKIVASAINDIKLQKEGIGIFVQYDGDIYDFINIIKNIKEIINENIGLEISDIVPIETIPQTVSGKVWRHRLGKMYNSGEFTSISQEIEEILLKNNMKVDKKNVKTNDEIEERLLNIWKRVLNNEEIDVCSSYFMLGVNSITMMEVCSIIQSEFRVDVDISTLFECKNIRNLSKVIKNKGTVSSQMICPRLEANVENTYGKFPLTEVQTAYLVGRDERYELGGISTKVYIELRTNLDISKLNRALQKVIIKHDMMRTIFTGNKQQILEEVPEYLIEIENLNGLEDSKIQERLIEERNRISSYIFLTEKWPLFEFKAIKCDENTHYLLIGLDMMILDADSIANVAAELMRFYDNEELNFNKIKFSFRDYILGYKKIKNSAIYERDKKYWMNKLHGFPLAPNLPTKVDVSEIEKPIFKRVKKIIDQERWEKLKNQAMLHNVTPSAVLCTIYLEILSLWSNQPKLSISLTVANRYKFNEDVEKLIGDFTAVLPVEADFNDNNTFWNKVKIIQKTIIKGLEHRSYEGVEFIRELSKLNNYGNKVVIPVVFTSLLSNDIWNNWGRIGEINYAITQTSQVYLDYQASEINGQLMINWDYVSNLLEDDMVEDMFNKYTDRVISICDEIESESFNAVSSKSRAEIEKYNNTKEEIELSLLHELFEEQVKKNPDNIAIINDNDVLTYNELNERANKVARKLKELGVKNNDLISVFAERCKESIINILGILKAGGAYVPIDPQYPKERIDYILEQSNCSVMLEPDFYLENKLDMYSGENLENSITITNIAYVIYTSGSTGKPKGVVITHGAASNTILDINRKYQISEKDRILGISSMCFDLSVYDIFGALSSGAALVQIPDQRDVANIYEVIKKHKITIWNSVPAIMDMMIQHINGSISYDDVKEVKNEVSHNEEIEKRIEGKEKYYWSPSVEWDEEFHVNDYVYIDSEMLKIFPKFYFFMKKGRILEEIHTNFSEVDNDKLKEFVQELINQGALVSTINNPHDVFKVQEKLFNNKYDENIKFNPQLYEKFKRKQLNRKFSDAKGEKVQLVKNYKFPSYIEDRYSHRKFNENEKIPFEYISQLLSVFMQKRVNNDIRYYYPCAGGLYPIDVFLYVKENRVENLEEGIYYYSPIDNSLYMVNRECQITDEAQYYTNKSIFNSSAVSIYMIYNAEVTMPKYGGSGYLYACIDTGIMVSNMVHVAEMLNIGTCSIGYMNFDNIRDYFKLNHNQVLIHAVEIGLKENVNVKEIGFDERQLIETQFNLKTFSNRIAMKNELVRKELAVTNTEDIKKNDNSSLRLVLLSGDWIPLSLPKKIKNNFKNAKVISLGGATEAAIWSIFYPIEEENNKWKSIPYGKPLANQEFYVLDYKGNLCNIEVPGELYIGGVGLAKCYMNDIKKTNESFINHPMFGRVYKTGDYGVMTRDGVIEFLGRKDQQVKIRGYRIELGEIETCIIKYPEIKNVAVVDYMDKGGKKYLCAYVVSDKKVNTQSLREFVLKELPEYMLPVFFIQIETIPLSDNGKVNKKSLPKPDVSKKENKELLKPRNELEEKILGVWKEVLRLDSIGVNENFFDVGGDSMLLLNVYSRINQMYPKILKITDLFTSTSISKLAEFLNNKIAINKKRVKVQAIELPREYFVERENIKGNSAFSFTIDAALTSNLKSVSNKETIRIEDLLAAFYIYTINQISGVNRINVQTILESKNTIHSIKVDFEKLTKFDQLLGIVKEKSLTDKYMINDINTIEIIKDNTSIIPVFLKKNLYNSSINLVEVYDYILVIDEHDNKIEFICEYNEGKLKAEKAKEIIYNYLRLINAYVERV